MKKTSRLKQGHEERFRDEEAIAGVALLKPEGDKARRFKATAYSGVDVSRMWGRMVINSSGLKRDEKTAMLLEHNDAAPVAVCESMEIDKKTGKVTLEGYFLSDKATGGESTALIARADEGFPLKMSVGVRFLKHHDIEEGAEEDVNGRKFSGPMTVIDEAHLFETSFIHASPADLNTSAAVMRKERSMDLNETTPTPTPAPAPTSEQLAVIREDAKKAALAEIKANETAFAKEFPKQPKFVTRMLREGKTLSEAREVDRQRALKRLDRLETAEKERAACLSSLPKGPGHVYGAAGTAVLELPPAKLEEQVEIEIVRDNRLGRLFGDDSRKALLALLRHEQRRSTSGKLLFSGDPTTALSIERMADDIMAVAKATGHELSHVIERLGIGKVGPDLGRITVRGFVGTYYNSYEEAMSPSAFQKLAYQLQSDQEAEIIRWLAAPPQLQEWKGPRIAKDLPIYTQLLQNKLFEATLKVSKWDFNKQKFDLINRSFGQWGGVTSQHWDQIFTTMVEANPTAYDTFAYFSRTHTLGGDSGTMTNDLTSGQGFGSLAIADPTLPTQIEAARILMQCTPHARTFKWANGIPMNGQARRWGVMVHPNFEGIFLGATSSNRLDTGQDNPLAGQKNQFEVIVNPYLTLPQYAYLFRLDTPNSPFLKAEPEPIQMLWHGPGSHFELVEHAFAMGLESARGIAPGAWESAMRLTLGAAA